MKPLKLISIADQVAAHLREQIESGTLAGEMPGAKKLAEQLGVNHKTIDAAAALLEKQGLLKTQGAGKARLVVPPKGASKSSLRIVILTYEPEDAQESKVIIDLRHSLGHAGHACVLSDKSQRELNWDVKRIEKMVKKTKADAWIIQSGSRDILEWFAGQDIPALALYGRFLDLPIAAAGVSKVAAQTDAVTQLTSMGHRRIVMLSQASDHLPTPSLGLRMFLEQLEAQGIQTSSYNLPHWESSPKGLHQALDSLFKLTPPTALIITDPIFVFPAYTHLLSNGITAPDKVSIISSDPQPQYPWCDPEIAHMNWNLKDIVNRILKWADATARGKEDKKQTFIEATLEPGGTIGPAPKS